MISAAFKIESSSPYHEIQLPPSGPHISFAGRIYSKPEEQENDCKFGVYLIEYNNFNFGNKEKMNFKIQVVYDAGPNSRFRKLSLKLDIGKLVYITGFLDLNDNELPFVEAKEIDLLDEFAGDQSLISKSPFSRISKFRSNKNVFIKKEQTSDSNLIEATSKNSDNEKEDEIIEESEISDEKDNEKPDENRKKQELMDLSTRRLKRGRSNAYKKDNDEVNEIIDVETNEPPPKKRAGRKKK